MEVKGEQIHCSAGEFDGARTDASSSAGRFPCASQCRCWYIDSHWPAGATRLRAACTSRRWLHLDARLLGLRSAGLLLGSRNLGRATDGGPAVDSGLLGLEQRNICLERRLLGAAHWLLRRRQLWLWLRRGR